MYLDPGNTLTIFELEKIGAAGVQVRVSSALAGSEHSSSIA